MWCSLRSWSTSLNSARRSFTFGAAKCGAWTELATSEVPSGPGSGTELRSGCVIAGDAMGGFAGWRDSVAGSVNLWSRASMRRRRRFGRKLLSMASLMSPSAVARASGERAATSARILSSARSGLTCAHSCATAVRSASRFSTEVPYVPSRATMVIWRMGKARPRHRGAPKLAWFRSSFVPFGSARRSGDGMDM